MSVYWVINCKLSHNSYILFLLLITHSIPIRFLNLLLLNYMEIYQNTVKMYL